ncbi:type I-C CRISPR-associated protein Cas7/Csd2 [Rhodovulum strictum]|uniref:Type I-C CRISPR-associated protein Cas7/Csd2 n=1 Tax=Rhodovulum strictum TaxID=58314 RepID=A0A844B8N2_9RHOB|nr:type I-C CRISPR-associated protein Cas7/Csd2 [Rhodovulum strictum]MRH22746.1 type I-C CRISPR-associated protein Cas7/Csd2 [Rhodovulum strictum]
MTLANRYDFALFFTVKDGNPNGDPDAGNLPRMDPETNNGLVTDVALKRKVRNYVAALDEPGKQIFIREKEPLNKKIAAACVAKELPTFEKGEGKWDKEKAKGRSQDDIRVLQAWLCANYYDIRAFGAVLSTGPNAGQVRGPVQLGFARSVEPIMPLEIAITRMADVDKEEGEMGRKHIVPFGLYQVHGFINAKLAEKTGFSEDDLTLFWTALRDMFDFDRSAARGEMAAQRLVVFRHESPLGNAQAHRLFERIKVERLHQGEAVPAGDARSHNWPPARAFSDYRITFDGADLPQGVSLVDPW